MTELNGGFKKAAVSVGTAMAILSALLFGGGREELPRAAGAYEIAATQDIGYRVADRPPQDLGDAIAYIRNVMSRPAHQGAGYVIKEVGMEWSRVRTLAETLDRLSERLAADEVDAYWTIMAVKDRFRMWVLKVDQNPAVVIDTDGSIAIDIIWGTISTRFDGVQNWGICACRRIAGTWTWSQHAWCNGLDVGGGTELLDRVAAYTQELARRGYLPVGQTLWRAPGHYNHIHYSGEPLRTGTPPCAS